MDKLASSDELRVSISAIDLSRNCIDQLPDLFKPLWKFEGLTSLKMIENNVRGDDFSKVLETNFTLTELDIEGYDQILRVSSILQILIN